MSAVRFRSELRAVFCCLFMSLMAIGCQGKTNDTFLCELHESEDTMPGLAAFRGRQGNSVDASIARYRDAMVNGSIDEAEGYFCIGELLIAANRRNEALAKYSKSITSNDSPYKHYLSRGRLLTELGDCAGALSDFESALKNGGDGFGVHLARAEAFIDCDYPEKALKALNAASSEISGEARPVNWSFTKGRVLASQGKYEEALQYVEDSVMRIGQMSNCLPVMSRCINPRLIEAVDLNTDLLCQIGKVNEAREVYQKHEKYQRPSPIVPYCLE